MLNEQFDLNNNSLNSLLTTNNHNDISYTRYVAEDTNLQVLCSPQTVYLNHIDKSFNVHDYECEFLLLKYITETNEHKSRLIKENEALLTLNRKPLTLPFQHNAVSLNSNDNNDLSSYINASYITAPFDHVFIAAENPLTETINNFWNLIFTQKITFVICISYTLSENNTTFTQYWPDNANIKQIDFNSGNTCYKIHLKEEVDINKDGDKINNLHSGTCVKRVFEIKPQNSDNVLSTITHVHLDCWENKSLPIQQMGFQLIVDLINQIDTHFTNTASPSPVLIHCSDGSGRTGTFIAIYSIIANLMQQNNNKIKQPVYNVFNTVRKLREERYGMVSEMHQYKYIYDFCKMWLKNYYK